MADEVRTKLVIDMAGTASKEMGQLAKDAYEVVDATKEANRHLRDTPHAAAARGIAAQEAASRRAAMTPAAHAANAALNANRLGMAPEGRYNWDGQQQRGAGLPTWAGVARGYGIAGVAAYATAAAGERTLTSFARAMDLVNNSSLDATLKVRGLAETIPIFGGLARAWNQFRDASTGANDIRREGDRRNELREFMAPVRARVEREQMDVRLRQADVAAQARAQAGVPDAVRGTVGYIGANRSTLAGEREYQFGRQLQPSLAAVAQAKADAERANAAVAAARREAEAADQRYRTAREEGGRLRAERDRLARLPQQYEDERGNAARARGEQYRQAVLRGDAAGAQAALRGHLLDRADFDRTQSSPERLIAMRQAQEGNIAAQAAETEGARTNALTAQARIEQEILAAHNKQLDLRRLQNEADRQRLSVLQQQEAILKGQAGSFGGLSKGEQNAALAFARQAQQFGFESLTPEMKAQLGRAGFSDYVTKGNIEQAAKDPAFQEISKILGETANLGTLSGNRAEQAKVEGQITVQYQVDVARLAAELDQKIRESHEKQLQAIFDAINVAIQGFEAKQILKFILPRSGG